MISIWRLLTGIHFSFIIKVLMNLPSTRCTKQSLFPCVCKSMAYQLVPGYAYIRHLQVSTSVRNRGFIKRVHIKLCFSTFTRACQICSSWSLKRFLKMLYFPNALLPIFSMYYINSFYWKKLHVCSSTDKFQLSYRTRFSHRAKYLQIY